MFNLIARFEAHGLVTPIAILSYEILDPLRIDLIVCFSFQECYPLVSRGYIIFFAWLLWGCLNDDPW